MFIWEEVCGKEFFYSWVSTLFFRMESNGKCTVYKGKTFKETVAIYGTSLSTFVRRFDRLSLSEIQKIKELPKVIAIDEYKCDTREGRYQLIIANDETKEPIDILPNRYKKTIKHYLQQHGANVEIVIMYMSPIYLE